MPSPQTTIYAKDLQGYVPVVDPRRLAKPSIIAGINFLDDVDGPRAAFGSQYANFVQFDINNKTNVTELSVGNETWYGTPKDLYKFDATSGQLVPMHVGSLGITQPFWPWTVAQVGGLYYFAQYNIGLWQYDPTANTMTQITLPVNGLIVKFICASYGRLIILCENSPSDLVLWSALDDGTNLTPSLTTGAGFQTVGLTGKTGYRVDPVSIGFIVSTNSGIMIGTYTGQNYLWAFRTLSTQVKIFSPNAGCIIPDQGVLLLDGSGMYITDGGVPEAWEPLMGEYFKQNQLQGLTSANIGCVDLKYSFAMKAVFASFSTPSREGNPTTSFVYLQASQKWGVFNEGSWSFVDILDISTNVVYAGYVTQDGYIAFFDNSYSRETVPADPYSFTDLLWRPSVEQAMLTVNSVQYGFTNFRFFDRDPTSYVSLANMGLYYFDDTPVDDFTADDMDFNDDPPLNPAVSPIVGSNTAIFFPEGGVFATLRAYQLPLLGLNAFLDVGPMRFEQQIDADETSAISSVIVGISPVESAAVFEDWNLLSGNEDYNAGPNSIDDWGAGSGTPDNFDFSLMSTNDGYNPGFQGIEDLTVVSNMGGSLFYSPMGYSAIWHRFQLSANDPGQGFALKYLDISGLLTGRMTFNG